MTIPSILVPLRSIPMRIATEGLPTRRHDRRPPPSRCPPPGSAERSAAPTRHAARHRRRTPWPRAPAIAGCSRSCSTWNPSHRSRAAVAAAEIEGVAHHVLEVRLPEKRGERRALRRVVEIADHGYLGILCDVLLVDLRDGFGLLLPARIGARCRAVALALGVVHQDPDGVTGGCLDSNSAQSRLKVRSPGSPQPMLLWMDRSGAWSRDPSA
jgi:hypothetical protein